MSMREDPTGGVSGTADPAVATLLPPLKVKSRPWTSWLSAAISVALMIAIILKLRDFGFARAREILPASPWFWAAFAAYYLVLPSYEWIIYRRLWKIPVDGFAALLRKLVSNEILFGYSGEAYFYTWARRRANLVAAPFGAVKDVAILSALAGNLTTLVMLAIAYPLVDVIRPEFNVEKVVLSAGFIIGLSTLLFVFRKRIFSLPRGDLWFIFQIHIARVITAMILSVAMWRTGLPDVPLIWLVFLLTLQLLVTRLPFVTNKEIVFASLAVFLVGNDATISTLIAVIATAILATHLLVGLLLVGAELLVVRR